MDAAIIILNYNSSNDCHKCIKSLKKQIGIESEIIVVDNCSSHDDCQTLKKICSKEKCTFLAATSNKGYSAGNNIGLRYAANQGYKYALIANPDMEFPQRDYLLCLITQIEKDDQIAVIGSDIVHYEGFHQNPLYLDENWRKSFAWIKHLFLKSERDSYYFVDNFCESHYCHKLSGCALVIRMSFIKDIGFFDEYPFLYCEEDILAQQVLKAGMKMYYLANAKAIHQHIKSKKSDPIQHFRHLKRSQLYFYRYYADDSWWGKEASIISTHIRIFLLMLRQRIQYK